MRGNRDRMELLTTRKGPLDHASQDSGTRIFFEEDPYSVIRLVSDSFRRAMLEIPEEWRGYQEGDIRTKHKITPTLNQLRLSFWLEYERCRAQMVPRMCMTNVFCAIVPEETFYQKILRDYRSVAWIITPPVSYTVRLEEMLHLGYERIREMLEAPLFDERTGKLDTAAAKLVLQATMMIDMRLKGGIVQKLEHKNISLNVNMKTGSQNVMHADQNLRLEEIEEELRRLEKREALLERIEAVRGTAEDADIPDEPIVVEKITRHDSVVDLGTRYELVTVDAEGNQESQIIESNK